MIENPFITYGYESAAYFCDRKSETKELTTLLTNGNHTALISPRRMGKTGLIHHCFAQNEEAYKDVIYQLTARQRDLLVAVGHEGKAQQITGAPFVKRYHLTSASSVQKSSQALIEKQLLTHQQGVYEVYDKFMAEWIRNQ